MQAPGAARLACPAGAAGATVRLASCPARTPAACASSLSSVAAFGRRQHGRFASSGWRPRGERAAMVVTAGNKKGSQKGLMRLMDSMFGAVADEGSGGPKESMDSTSPPRTILLDGANLAWSYGETLAGATGGVKRPLSEGIVAALAHKPWEILGYEVKVYLPFEYMEGAIETVVDGGKPGVAREDCLEKLDKQGREWRNTVLYELYKQGDIVTVVRASAASDDLTMIQHAKICDGGRGAYLLSNDKFRDHKRSRNMGFDTKRRFRHWLETRRMGYSFRVDLSALEMTPEERAAAAGKDIRFWELPTAGGHPPRPVTTFHPVPNQNMLKMEAWASRRAGERGMTFTEVMNSDWREGAGL